MSRTNEVPKPDEIGLDNSPTGERHENARGGMSREAAHREMDRFRGADEYNVRKLVRRRSEQSTHDCANTPTQNGVEK